MPREKKEKKRIISIDPGRANLITAWYEEKDQFLRLTRRQYYKSSGMLKRTQKTIRRNLELKGVYEAMSNTPTANTRTFGIPTYGFSDRVDTQFNGGISYNCCQYINIYTTPDEDGNTTLIESLFARLTLYEDAAIIPIE